MRARSPSRPFSGFPILRCHWQLSLGVRGRHGTAHGNRPSFVRVKVESPCCWEARARCYHSLDEASAYVLPRTARHAAVPRAVCRNSSRCSDRHPWCGRAERQTTARPRIRFPVLAHACAGAVAARIVGGDSPYHGGYSAQRIRVPYADFASRFDSAIRSRERSAATLQRSNANAAVCVYESTRSAPLARTPHTKIMPSPSNVALHQTGDRRSARFARFIRLARR